MTDPEASLDADALRTLEDRLDRATRTAERLLGEAAARGTHASSDDDGELPPSGWQRRDRGAEAAAGGPWLDAADAERLLAALAGILERIPQELEQRLMAALHELLLAIRALVDWCLERAQRRQAPGPEVQDIPIL